MTELNAIFRLVANFPAQRSLESCSRSAFQNSSNTNLLSSSVRIGPENRLNAIWLKRFSPSAVSNVPMKLASRSRSGFAETEFLGIGGIEGDPLER